MSGEIEVDDVDWPMLRVRWPSVGVGADALDRFAREMERAYGRGERVAVIVDARRAAPIGPRALAKAIAIERRAKDALACRAIIVEGATAVRVLEGVLAALRPRVPTRGFADPSDAEAWSRAQLAR